MEGTINAAKDCLNSDQGRQLKDQLFSGDNRGAGDDQNDSPSYDAQGNQGAPGQFGQEGQYGAVTGKGFGGGISNRDDQNKDRQSPYEGMGQYDSTATGGYGSNAQGSSFSRQNQMGTDNDNNANPGGAAGYNDDGQGEGAKTGYSTPGYRKEGDDDDDQARRANQNTYGQQSDDRGARGNDYNEADI